MDYFVFVCREDDTLVEKHGPMPEANAVRLRRALYVEASKAHYVYMSDKDEHPNPWEGRNGE